MSVPYDESAERQTLAALLIDRDAIYRIVDLLRTDDFYVGKHQRIYAACQALLERRERIDVLTVNAELARSGLTNASGGEGYVEELSALVPTAMAIEPNAQSVHEKALLRRLYAAAAAIASDAYAEPTDVALALDAAEQRVFALRDENNRAQLRHIQLALQAHYEYLVERLEHPIDVTGVASGYPDIDFYTQGFERGDLIVVAARPSVGKTSLALGMVNEMAKRGHPALVFSLEMDVRQIVSRFVGLNGTTNLLALTTGQLMDSEAASRLMHLPVYIDDTPGVSIMEVRTKARRVKSRSGLDVIVIDYLQLMRTEGGEENRVQEIASITRNLKALARELNVVVISLSQLSRAAPDAGSEPKLSTLRESGAIEQDADIVVMLWRPGEEPPADAPRLIKGSVAKNRNGPTGPFELFFEAAQARFFSRSRDDGIPV